MGLAKLTSEERLRLMKFVCSFVWADLEVHEKEKTLVRQMVKNLHLTPDEAKMVERWLIVPPRAEEVDPAKVPLKHRELLLDSIREVIAADGRLDPAERENLDLLQQLLR